MNSEEYIAERVDSQISWYSSRSRQAQLRFKWLRGFEIAAAASIPLLAGFGRDVLPVDIVVAVLGALIALASALVSLNQYQENWIEYRTCAESLKHEKFLFLTGAEPYGSDAAFSLFVNRIEALISKENRSWSQNVQSVVERAESG
ncbi:hypothetical protein GCM10011348_14970 [Marinobacterium nitratireducens]|uniref:DUF4231 domain-containing protein n=1 Tax=Marinobacterium nitratireducens TaxID=518897 RepID=A0A917ZBK9_9GAMM|nr:DUF4231 domain-containing protein [Marinobacterium nitratireducens]GGO79786.1 hypothetical protein GCM10011348_14970 [Marinobacterium nitratireducens]